jgi:predicted Zn-dependent peptidase
MYNKTLLKSGIKVITEEIPFFKSASIGLWVNTGSKDEPPDQNGISHFIEHMIFKGTKTRSATEIAEIMDNVGGQLNAFTEKEQTCYYARMIDRHVPLAIELLADMLLNSVYDAVELERERGVILEEIRMYDDSPDEIIFDIFTQAVLDRHPLGRPILGTREVVTRLGRDDILSHLNTNYVPHNLIVAAAGNIKHEEIVHYVEHYFGALSTRGKGRRREKAVPLHKKSEIIKYRDCEQVYIVMGGRGVSQRDDNKYKVSVLDSILGGSMSSRLFQEIREKRGLVYSVCSFQNQFLNTGLFGVFAGTSVENLDPVISLVFQIIKDMKENGVDEKELTRAKEQLKGTISLALESTSNRMIRLAKSEIYHGRLVPHEEVFEKIEAVTREGIYEISQTLLDWEDFSISILGPIDSNLKIIR